ncbi:MAG: hypothetical protein ACKVT0_04430, partial [Planctomycetaceae bacterium]
DPAQPHPSAAPSTVAVTHAKIPLPTGRLKCLKKKETFPDRLLLQIKLKGEILKQCMAERRAGKSNISLPDRKVYERKQRWTAINNFQPEPDFSEELIDAVSSFRLDEAFLKAHAADSTFTSDDIRKLAGFLNE